MVYLKYNLMNDICALSFLCCTEQLLISHNSYSVFPLRHILFIIYRLVNKPKVLKPISTGDL